MKINFLTALKPALFAIPFLIFSCNDEPDPVTTESKVAVVEEQFEVNAAYEDIDLLAFDALQGIGLGARILTDGDICSNTVITNNALAGKLTIDFGTGCTSPNGVERKGKILISYSLAELLSGKISANITLEGYEADGLKIEGIKTITGNLPSGTGPVSLNVKIENGKVTWPDNSFATYTSTQTRMVTLGENGSVVITGTAAGTGREGFAYTALVTEELVLNQECVRTNVFVPSSGKMDFNVLDISVLVDLGTGACDKLATVTYPGGSKEITLD